MSFPNVYIEDESVKNVWKFICVYIEDESVKNDVDVYSNAGWSWQ